MAKQHGFLKLEGTIGDITFLKTQDGFLAKDKGGVSAQRIANDPAYERTRENMAEFGRAGKAADLLKLALDPVLVYMPQRRMFSRILTELMKVIKSDLTSLRGQRNLRDGRLTLINGFEFNPGGRLSSALKVHPTAAINRTTGDMTVSVGQFIPKDLVKAPPGAGYFKLIAAGIAINFDGNDFSTRITDSGYIPWDEHSPGDIELTCNMGASSPLPLVLAFGIQFFEKAGSNYYPSKQANRNALQVVKVSRP